MCNFFKPDRDHRDDGAMGMDGFIMLIAFALLAWALIAGSIKLALTRTGAGQYIVNLLMEAFR